MALAPGSAECCLPLSSRHFQGIEAWQNEYSALVRSEMREVLDEVADLRRSVLAERDNVMRKEELINYYKDELAAAYEQVEELRASLRATLQIDVGHVSSALELLRASRDVAVSALARAAQAGDFDAADAALSRLQILREQRDPTRDAEPSARPHRHGTADRTRTHKSSGSLIDAGSSGGFRWAGVPERGHELSVVSDEHTEVEGLRVRLQWLRAPASARPRAPADFTPIEGARSWRYVLTLDDCGASLAVRIAVGGPPRGEEGGETDASGSEHFLHIGVIPVDKDLEAQARSLCSIGRWTFDRLRWREPDGVSYPAMVTLKARHAAVTGKPTAYRAPEKARFIYDDSRIELVAGSATEARLRGATRGGRRGTGGAGVQREVLLVLDEPAERDLLAAAFRVFQAVAAAARP